MKAHALIFLLAALPSLAMAQHELKSETTQTTHSVEMRQSAGFSYGLPKGFSVGLEQEFRESLYDRTYAADGALAENNGAYFSKSYTTVELGWKCLSYTDPYNNYKYALRLDAGYTLRILAQKGWTDPKQYIQHRPQISLAGSIDFGNWKLSLRERYLVEIRLDSVSVVDRWNPDITIYEHNPYAMELRHRLRLEYSIPGRPLKPYASVELTNTLNEQSCPWLNDDGQPLYSGQYLNSVRASLGLRWKINKHNSLSAYYMFYYLRERDVNITRAMQHVELTHATEFKHVFTLAYELGY